MLASSAVANKAQPEAINNGEALKCFDHSMFPQNLFSSQLSQDSAKGKPFSDNFFTEFFWRIFKHKYLNALKNMLAVSKVYSIQANQGE